MPTVMPEGENLRKAIKWISSMREEKKDQVPLAKLVEEASLKFDLSPVDQEFLFGFFRKKD